MLQSFFCIFYSSWTDTEKCQLILHLCEIEFLHITLFASWEVFKFKLLQNVIFLFPSCNSSIYSEVNVANFASVKYTCLYFCSSSVFVVNLQNCSKHWWENWERILLAHNQLLVLMWNITLDFVLQQKKKIVCKGKKMQKKKNDISNLAEN